jgi:hypothetical protein
MQTAEISDKTCHQTADLIHAHANARTPVFCDPNNSKNLFHAKVLVRKYAHLEVRRPTIWVKILVQFGITS